MSSSSTAARFATTTRVRPAPRVRASRAAHATSSSGTLVLFAIALLASASLSFLLEPLFARMVLPLFGGAPAVWNTCVVFYQLVLLAGYLYAHAVSRWLAPKTQVVAQLGVMVAALAVLPVAPSMAWMPKADAALVPGILLMLVASIGLPFFAVSTIAPLLQRWFSRTGHKDAADPYFLYAASNVGSFLGLLSYPIVIEPNLRVSTQSQLWVVGYALLIALVALAGARVWRLGDASTAGTTQPATREVETTAKQRVRWVLLSAVPASLMLSVTTYASTDIAAVPLLWVLPLALYLLTFVLAFSGVPLASPRLAAHVLPFLVLAAAYSIVTEATRPIAVVLPLHLVTFVCAAFVCHSELARSRPGVSQLTEFYVWIAVGGALGGLFNVLAAPQLFTRTTEYPLALALACFLRPAPAQDRTGQARLVIDAGVAVLPMLVLAGLAASARFAGLTFGSLTAQALVVGLPLLMTAGLWAWPRKFGIALAGVFVAGGFLSNPGETVLHAERTFYGAHRVIDTGSAHVLMSGTTNHGAQANDPGKRLEPLTYYGRTGPIGQVFQRLKGDETRARVGIVGLGTASLSAYQRPGESWTYYEINPAVDRIARDPQLFTMLETAGRESKVVLGDARLSLASSGETYDFLVLDAFSSDAIPVHLMTREAVQLYLKHLAPNGVLAFHISNRHLDLASVVANLAASEDLVAIGRQHAELNPEEQRGGLSGSTWVALARSATDLAPMIGDTDWQHLRGNPETAWTDDFSNIWSVFRW